MMKTFLICLVIAFLAGCKKSDDPITVIKSVNDVVLTPKQLSVPVTNYETGPYSIQSVLVGNSIYFGNWSNTTEPQYFVRYDISSNAFSSALAKSTNVCTCGYNSHLVTDGTNVYYIANDATKYTASSNTWTSLNYPALAKDNAGEAGVVYHNGNIYFVGGRTASTVFKYYSVGQDKWSTAPNYLSATTSSEMAAYKDRVYVLGGQGATKKMAYFSTSSNTWTSLNDIPFEVLSSSSNIFSAVLGDFLYLLQGQSVQIYDLANDVWATTPITLTGLPTSANLFSNGQKLYISGKNTSNIPVVTEVVVSSK